MVDAVKYNKISVADTSIIFMRTNRWLPVEDHPGTIIRKPITNRLSWYQYSVITFLLSTYHLLSAYIPGTKTHTISVLWTPI